MSTDVKTSRPYRSERRAADAAETRRRILESAAELFSARGYAATRMQDIARAAGVAVDTVYASGSKRSLLMAAFEQAFSGREGSDPISERPEARALLEIADEQELLVAFVALVASQNAGSARMWPALRGAAHADPEIAADFEALLARRHTDFLGVVRSLEERGLLPAPRSADALAHALEFLVSPDGYEELVLRGGLTMDEYQDWLVGQLRATLAAAGAPAGR